MNGHPHMLIERRAALAQIVRDMHQMIYFLRNAHQVSSIHGLDLELPKEQPLLDVIGACVKAHQQTEGGR